MSYIETEAARTFRASVENAPHFTADMTFDYIKAQFGGFLNLLKDAEEANKNLQLEVFGEVREIPDFSKNSCTFSIVDSWEDSVHRVDYSFLVCSSVVDLPEEFFLQPNVHINTGDSPWQYRFFQRIDLFAHDIQLAGETVKFDITTDLYISAEVPEETEEFLRSLPGKVVEETHTYTSSSTSLICEI